MNTTTLSIPCLLTLAAALPAQQFRPDGLLPLNVNTSALIAEDLDGDGDTDFAIAAALQSQVLENIGSGRFTLHPGQPIASAVGSATRWERGDLDGDGDADLVGSGDAILILRNDRTALVDVTSTHLVANSPPPTGRHVLIDADQDGDLDLIVQGGGVASRLFLNSGSGVFTEVATSPLPATAVFTTGWVVSDLDRDGHGDLVVLYVDSHRPATWMWRQGTYVDETATRLPFLPRDFAALAVVDTDRDGDSDLLLVSPFSPSSGAVLLVNDGHGVFADASVPLLPTIVPQFDRVLPFDAEGDGDPDLLLSSNSAALLLSNDGSGSFASVTGSWRGEFTGTALQAIDLDRDGFADLLGTQGIFRHSGSGYCRVHPTASVSGVPVDVDVDGDIDALGGNLWRNEAGRFTPEGLPCTPVLACGDLDGDGDADVIGSGLRVWRNNGSGSFALAQSLPPGTMLNGAALGDVDGDGDLDLATAEGIDVMPLQVQNRLLLNDGSGRFTDATATHLPVRLGGERLVLLADADADGDLDLLYVSFGLRGRQLSYLVNQGSGVFALAAVQPLVGTGPSTAAFAQLDLDVELELVVQYTYGLSMFDYSGGSWQDVTSSRVAGILLLDPPFSLLDYDEDGDVDLLLGRIFANDGSGFFTEVTGAGYAFGRPADIDGDGDLDLIGGGVQINQQRQLRAPLPPQTGQPWLLEFTAMPGAGHASHLALVGLGLTRLPRATVTPFGSFALGQPSLLVAAVVSTGGIAGTATVAVPADPALTGLQLWLQGIELSLPSGNFHFTNLVKTAIE